MKKVHLASNGWEVICCPEDGGRLESLRFAGVDLLTVPHARVPPNASDYGRYETRPVYGYDDCFPSVDPCRSPAGGHAVPDHGELCWLPWQVQAEGNRLRCRVSSDVSPVEFSRTLTFGEGALKWDFMVTNKSRNVFPFLHVMHALLPVNEVEEIHLPAFSELFDEANDRPMKVMGREALSRRLLNLEWYGSHVSFAKRKRRRCPSPVSQSDQASDRVSSSPFPDARHLVGQWRLSR